jgi:iron complex transport system ATP-binding protein
MGRYPYIERFQKLSDQDNQVIEDSMKLIDIEHLSDRKLSELSGGERQRVYICQSLVQEPQLILLDEPTSHLDISHQVQILDLLTKLNKQKNITVIIILHDLNLASEYCDRLILLNQGKIVKDDTVKNVLKYDIIEQVYKTIVVVLENPVSKRPHIVLVPGK